MASLSSAVTQPNQSNLLPEQPFAYDKYQSLDHVGTPFIDEKGSIVVSQLTPMVRDVLMSSLSWVFLKSLSLGEMNLRDEDVTSLVTALQKNPHVTSLNLANNEIGDEGAKQLFRLLDPRVSKMDLTELRLYRNRISCEGVIELERLLPLALSLKFLLLTENQIQCRGAKAIAQGILHNTSLRRCHLAENDIGNEGRDALIAAYQASTALTQLVLHGNPFEDDYTNHTMETLNGINFDRREALEDLTERNQMTLVRLCQRSLNTALSVLPEIQD